MFHAVFHTLREDVYSSEQSAHNSVIMTPLAGARTTFQCCLEKLRHAIRRVQAGVAATRRGSARAKSAQINRAARGVLYLFGGGATARRAHHGSVRDAHSRSPLQTLMRIRIKPR